MYCQRAPAPRTLSGNRESGGSRSPGSALATARIGSRGRVTPRVYRSEQQHGQASVPRLLEHASRGELDPSFLATHRFPLEDAPAGDGMFKHKEGGCVRAVFTP